MNPFVQSYPSKIPVLIRSIPTDSFHVDGTEAFLAGSMDDSGWFGKFDNNGLPLWQYRYVFEEAATAFRHSLQCDNGDFIMYGSYIPKTVGGIATPKSHSLVVRVGANGKVIWAKVYYGNVTSYYVGIVKSLHDSYIFVSRLKQGETGDEVELTKIDGDGNVLKSVRTSTKHGHQMIGLIPLKDGCIVYGNTSATASSKGVVMAFDGGLALQFSLSLGNKDYQTVSGMVALGNGNLVITGENGKDRNSYIAELNINATSITAHQYDFKKDNESGLKFLRRGPRNGFYLVADMPGKPPFCFVARLDAHYHLQWVRRFKLNDELLLDLQYDEAKEKDGLLICGMLKKESNHYDGLLACTDAKMNSCVTQDLPVPIPSAFQFAVESWEVKTEEPKIDTKEEKPKREEAGLKNRSYCGEGLPLDVKGALFQSPYIYLQTVGSTHLDSSAQGYHLRWLFMRKLGEQHLPKGNLAAPGGVYPTNIAFNRSDDFVRIYKTDFNPEFGITIDFSHRPTVLIEAGPTRDWLYQGLSSTAGLTTDVLLRFTNVVLYNFLRQTINPSVNPLHFLAHYNARIELRPSGKRFFHLNVLLTPVPGFVDGTMRLETISLPDRLDPATRQVSSRRILTTADNGDIVGENWEYLRFDLNHVVPARIYLIPYEDYIAGINARGGWDFWNQYSLDDGNSDGNAQVYKLLEDPANYTIDKEWQKFNEPKSLEFRVNVDNYKKRWTMGGGIQQGVITYLDKSRIDPLANVVLPNQDAQANDSESEMSYLWMLKFAGLDFHVGRMLGFGAIDPDSERATDKHRVYLMQYYTSASLENEPAALVSHVYMAPPITKLQHRLPPPAALLPVVYGLSADSCGGTTALTDIDGYAQFGNVRFVNLHRGKFLYENAFGQFFQNPKTFDSFLNTQPVLFGVEYAPGSNGMGSWVRPEISHDVDWLDPAGMPEVRPIPNSGENLVYTHGETTEGIHHYALYSINWFSRVSEISNQVQTDTTVFPSRSTMQPPSNFMVQLIQKETPTILTSSAEQGMLAAMGDGDKTLVRVTFDWNKMHNKAYQYADNAQFFFRVAAPLVVRGKVSAVSENTITHTALLTTASYVQSSQPTTIQPTIAATDMGRFIGSSIVVDGQSYIVEAIMTSGNNPQIRVRQIRQTTSMDSLNDNNFCTTENFVSPSVGKPFLMVENLEKASAWDTQFTTEVTITQFLPEHTEVDIHPDGQTTTNYIGGLTGEAMVSHVYDTDPDLAPFIPSGGPPPNQVPTGIYTVAFTTALLPPHPEFDVSYYQGTIRLRTSSGEIKELQVWNIDLSGAHPVLVVFDSTYSLQRDANGIFILSAGQFAPTLGVDAIVTGVVPFANFHPGYRVYLYADLSMGHNFGEDSILPSFDEGTKQTLMAVRSKHTAASLESYVSTPAILMAREIREPVPPAIPLGNMYATRPNFYNKATFTFDVQVSHPYSLIFYKANERKILDQLYHPDKVTEILDALANLTEADKEFNQNRWSDLVNMVTDADGNFITYVPGGYHFPPPTNPEYVIPEPMLDVNHSHPFDPANMVPPGSTAIVQGTGRSWAAIVREAITGAFVPLTEQPVVYSQINSRSIITSGRPPKIRDTNGARIPATNSDYDPWPMVVRFERNNHDQILVSGNAGYDDSANRRFIRFTDYNLDGAATNIYFYFSKELSNTMQVSAASPVIGPVKLVNSAPAEAPGIGRIITLVKNSEMKTRDGVSFELNEYLPVEGIRSIQLYRAMTADDALSVRTMVLVKTVDAGTVLTDTFDDVSFIPYNEPVYYRIIALRAIKNERGEEELIPSKPSNVVMASLIDNTNPPAPPLAYSSDPPIGSPALLHNVVLTWLQTCYKGRYLLYKLSIGGHWVKIAEVPGNNSVFSQPLATTDLHSGTLAKQDEDLKHVFHQFKVVAINSSGLISREESILRI